MQGIKLLALDVDGTLVPYANAQVAEADANAIRRAQAAGVIVTLATGRLYNIARRWIRQFQMDGPIISINGADVRTRDESVYVDRMDLELVKEWLETYRNSGIHRFISAENMVYYTEDDHFLELERRWDHGYMGKCPVTVLKTDKQLIEAISEVKVQKCMAWMPGPEYCAKLEALAQPYRKVFSVVRGDPCNLEFTCKGTSKGKALERLAAYYGFDIAETMAIGDSGNDVQMLRAAGIGVAMGNAMHETLDAADYVTADVDHGGIAQAIEKFILKN
ncbi:MAG: HAD family hydrolase [Christensenella sp.]|nr:HAD family hydrolase [Christensenella sp.]